MKNPCKTGTDTHVIRYCSSRITVSGGKVTKVGRPSIAACPLAGYLYPGLSRSRGVPVPRVQREIRRVIEDKIARIGFCTASRQVWDDGIAIPYGASEVMAHGLRKGAIDAAVLVCDGAGTVITSTPEVVQGIGARMHSVMSTSPIPDVINRLYDRGCLVVFNDGAIDQAAGVREAAEVGCDTVAVTVNGYRGESLSRIRALERKKKVKVIILMTCTTGAGRGRVDEIASHADIVWACHSAMVRKRMEKVALKRLSDVSPVYILTKKGADLVSGYSPNIFTVRKEMAKGPGDT